MLQTSAARHGNSARTGLSTTFAPQERQVLSEIELAHRWGMSPKTLQRWRSEGRGPKYLKLSKRVTYPLDSISEFERSSLHFSTSERIAGEMA